MRAVLANSRPRLCLAHACCLLALRREDGADVELGGGLVDLLLIELLVKLEHPTRNRLLDMTYNNLGCYYKK